jgi:hypothetical protein
MLDLAGIVFSSVMMLMIIVRAIRLDRLQPWFKAVKRQDAPADGKGRPWRPHG